MAYAINICDLTKLVPGPINAVGLLVGPVTPNRTIVEAEPKRIDGGAVLLECNDERAEAVIYILRKKEPNKNLMRCYHSKTGKGGWRRVDNPAASVANRPLAPAAARWLARARAGGAQ